MATKRVRDLTYDDIGKQVRVEKPSGDRISGKLRAIYLADFSATTLRIDEDTMTIKDPDQDIQFIG